MPADEWDEVLRRAHPQQQQWLLETATETDQRSLSEDERYLRGLRRDLARIETEHARREAMTPEQRAAERARRVAKRRSVIQLAGGGSFRWSSRLVG